MITNYDGKGRYYITWYDRAQVADELCTIIVHEQPKQTTIDELTDWLDTRCVIVDHVTGDMEYASWFAADIQQRLGYTDDLRCRLDHDGCAVYDVRFTDERTNARRLYIEMTLDYHTGEWRGDQGCITDEQLSIARFMISGGLDYGSLWPYELLTFEVRH